MKYRFVLVFGVCIGKAMVFTCFELYFCFLSGQGGRPEISTDLVCRDVPHLIIPFVTFCRQNSELSKSKSPLVNIQIAIEHGHRNSGFSH